MSEEKLAKAQQLWPMGFHTGKHKRLPDRAWEIPVVRTFLLGTADPGSSLVLLQGQKSLLQLILDEWYTSRRFCHTDRAGRPLFITQLGNLEMHEFLEVAAYAASQSCSSDQQVITLEGVLEWHIFQMEVSKRVMFVLADCSFGRSV